jgi:hypothetical protein
MSQQRSPGSVLTRIGIICALLVLSLLPVRFAAATSDPTIIYVSPSGKDLEDTPTISYGTLANPYATLNFAIGKAVSGTTTSIKLMGGTYPMSDIITWSYPSGTVSKPITVEPYNAQTPILECSTTIKVDSCLKIGAEYIKIRGLEIKKSKSSGIAVLGGRHVQLLNNHIYESRTQGIYVSGEWGTTDDIVVDGNQVHNNALNFPLPLTPTSAQGGWSSGIGIQHQATNVTVTNNLVYHNNGEGIGISSKVGTVVSGNIIHDNLSVNMYINGARNATVERNLIYTSDNDTYYYRYNAPANGISVSNEDDLDANTLSNLIIRNNIVVGGRHAFYYGGYEKIAGGMKNSFIVNNTFYTNKFYPHSVGNSSTVFIGLDKDSNGMPVNNHAGTTFSNNAVMHNTSSGAIRDISSAIPSSSIEFKHNGWYTLGGTPGTPGGSPLTDKTTNPLFAYPGGVTPDSYKLLAGSPLINAGAASAAATDFWGDLRPQGAVVDIGADEFIALSSAQPRFEATAYRIDESGLSNENVAQVKLKVILPAAQPNQITLSYSTVRGSADPGADYQAVTGNIQFLAGQTTSQTIIIPLLEDGLAEEDEDFAVRLSNGASAIVAIATNDKLTFHAHVVYVSDAPPSSGETPDQWNGVPTNPLVAVTLKLNAPSRLPVSVTVATREGTALANIDYGDTAGIVTFSKQRYSYTTDTTSSFFTVNMITDTINDDGEEFYVDALSATNAGITQPSMTIITSNSGAQ